MSHEHEGPGGMLDSAEQFIEERIARKVQFGDLKSPEGKDADAARAKLKISSFIKPKANRSKLIQGILQLKINVILCFRSKEKIQPKPGGEPTQLGWQPIGGDEFWYEMTARALLLPGANGVPTWVSQMPGEKMAIRRPKQFANILRDGAQLSEDMGEAMARWATGNVVLELATALERVKVAPSKEALKSLATSMRGQSWSPEDRAEIVKAITARQSELKEKT